MTALDLTGLSAGPAQVWGGIRLVPLLRAEPVAGLRLHREAYGGGDFATEDVRLNDGTHYTSYIPHGFVADWSGEGTAAAYGTNLGGAAPAGRVALHRMAKRRPGDRLRFLPLHLALEGYLALHFGGPSTLWDTWSRQALRSGLSPRVESAYLGADVPGLADALRVFEIHPRQCGVLVYAADALGAAFAVPHPDDYRALHATLLQDLFGELIHQYALFGRPAAEFTARIEDRHVRGIGDLRAAVRAQERAWREAHDTVMAAELYATSYAFSRVYRMGGFDLWRFLPPFERGGAAQHIGEAITDRKGRVAYLKTFRLSENQVRRGHLLRSLAAHDWHLGRCAEALGTRPAELTRRIRDAGFASLLRERG
ncbi:hypothetical protein ACFYN0_31010 [Streptomyces sp. NPDC006704]|uniref:ARPP-2 domain-containing protein n=1 Tax=Streptomyces sp. NPDC006704 TaxID=3364760 RepID=UPI0036B91103